MEKKCFVFLADTTLKSPCTPTEKRKYARSLLIFLKVCNYMVNRKVLRAVFKEVFMNGRNFSPTNFCLIQVTNAFTERKRLK